MFPSLNSVLLCSQNAPAIDLRFRTIERLILLDDCSLASQGQVLIVNHCTNQHTHSAGPEVYSLPSYGLAHLVVEVVAVVMRCVAILGEVSRALQSEWSFHTWGMAVRLGSDSPDCNL